MLNFIFFILNVIFAFVFWKSADIAWEDGRKGEAYTHLVLSAFNGAAVFSVFF